MSDEKALRFLRLPQVLALTGLSKTTIYSLAQRGEFPRPIALSPRTSAWPEHLINEWATARLAGKPWTPGQAA